MQAAYKLVTETFQRLGIGYYKKSQGAFFVWANFQKVLMLIILQCIVTRSPCSSVVTGMQLLISADILCINYKSNSMSVTIVP